MKYTIASAPTRVEESYVDGKLTVWLKAAEIAVIVSEFDDKEQAFLLRNGLRQYLADKYASPEKYPTITDRQDRIREVLSGGAFVSESGIRRETTTEYLAETLRRLQVAVPKGFGKMAMIDQWKQVGAAWAVRHAPSLSAEQAIAKLAPTINAGIEAGIAKKRAAAVIEIDLPTE